MNDVAFSTCLAAGERDHPTSMPEPSCRPLRPAGQALDLALALLDRGKVALNDRELRRLRHVRLMSQQDLADECWKRNIRVSIATIKRAESGRAVRFRIARELARCFGVPVEQILGVPTRSAE